MSLDVTRRRLLSVLSGTTAVALAGCSELARSVGEGSPANSDGDAASNASTSSTSGSTPEPPSETPGYEEDHWHGRLFFEIDGDVVDFTQPKYHLEKVQDENEDAIHFHFHESAHGFNEWSNEIENVTLAQGLNLLPGIGYEQGPNGEHVVTHEGTTYREGESGTEISIYEGTERIDPTRHWVRHAEVYWVHVDTDAPGIEPPDDHGDARVGKLFFDINNNRLTTSDDWYLTPESGTDTLHFHDDGHPYRWYNEGSTATFADLLNVLPGITYREEGGGHVVEVEGRGDYNGTYRSNDEGTTITTRQRATDVRPAAHELRTGDILWIYVHAPELAPENEH